MTTTPVPTRRAAARARRGMTLIEVIMSIVILSGAMLGLANFVRKFQHGVSDTSSQTLASDLSTQRLAMFACSRSRRIPRGRNND